MTDRIELPENLRVLLLDAQRIPAEVEVNKKIYKVERPVASGFKAAVWKVKDEFGRSRALKLCIYEEYQDHSYLQEVARASALESCNQFAALVDAGIASIILGDLSARKFVCFVEEWINGLSLDCFLEQKKHQITVTFLLGYIRDLCQALHELKSNNLQHDDLHLKNVMIVTPRTSDLDQSLKVKIVDMGSVKPSEPISKKQKNDHVNFVEHVSRICNEIHDRQPLSARDRRFLSETKRLIGSMLDDDPSTLLSEPNQIRQQFDLAYTRANAPRSEGPASMSSPFEFISAEHISDDRLLVSIFAKSCPWLEKAAGPDPCLLTGPRGCGKSTIFRWLSLKAHLHKPSSEVDSFLIAGFYISCSTDLQNRLGWLSTPALAERYARETVHFFNLLLAREVVLTLSMIAGRSDREEYWGLGLGEEKEVYNFFKTNLSLTSTPIQGVSVLAQIAESIEAEMLSTHSNMVRNVSIRGASPETFLGDLTSLLSRKIRFFEEKRIAFLLDDFSSHRLPEPVQAILNRVIWERRPSHVFKLSSEKYGAILSDSFNATADVSRELVQIDCGKEYISLDDSEQIERTRAFAIELLDNRLKAANYQGTAEGLIGHSKWQEGTLGKALAVKKKGASSGQYHGLECIASICSGDVSTLLFLYRKMFDKAGVKKESTELIPKMIQHDSIVSASRELLVAIKHHFPVGQEMFSIVNEFGNLVRNILQNKKKQNDGNPTQCPRIEIDHGEAGADDELAPPQKLIAKELVRRAIFIEMEPGLSRHSNVTTLRWHLRRIYLPAFGASLTKNDAVKQGISWLKFFLTNPREACQWVYSKWPDEQQREPSEVATDDLPLYDQKHFNDI